MDAEEVTLMVLKGMISEMLPEDRNKVMECASKLKDILEEYGDHGAVALGLVGAEASRKEGK